MKMYLIFYAGALYAEVDTYRSAELPDGAYVYSRPTKQWYVVQWCSCVPMNEGDIDNELKVLLMICT